MATPAALVEALRHDSDPDAMVLFQLAEAGADLRKPHVAEFVFDVPHEADAEALAQALGALGFEVVLYAPEAGHPQYEVIARRCLVLDLAVVTSLTRALEALATRHAASFDGWGAEIVE